MRARPDQRHLAAKDVPELRQFLDAGPANAVDSRYPQVALRRLRDDMTILRHGHGAEFPNLELLADKPATRLPEDQAALRVQLDHDPAGTSSGASNSRANEARPMSRQRFCAC